MERLDGYEICYVRTNDNGHLIDNVDISQTRSNMRTISLRQPGGILSTQCDSLQTFLDDNMPFSETKNGDLETKRNCYFDRIGSNIVN